jgi:hypothetical protein
MALRAATEAGDDAEAYRRRPPDTDEFRFDDALAWDAEGWEGFGA